MTERKITPEQLQEAADRYLAGETIAGLAREYGVAAGTLQRHFNRMRVKRDAQPAPTLSRDMTEFAKRARSILWRQDSGSEKKTYDQWKTRVDQLQAKDGGGLTHNQAIVRASKEFPCLTRLFREYSVEEFDPNPESHPQIQHFGQQQPQAAVHCEGKEQSYRENLRWAIEAAGTHLRTGQHPTACPNDAAWYLYRQAIEEPKDFLSRVGQVESKGDAESEERRSARKAGQRTLDEIDEMLASLEEPEEAPDGTS